MEIPIIFGAPDHTEIWDSGWGNLARECLYADNYFERVRRDFCIEDEVDVSREMKRLFDYMSIPVHKPAPGSHAMWDMWNPSSNPLDIFSYERDNFSFDDIEDLELHIR
jgi:hypothetical protein